jgi:UDP-glucose:(heptosyl)LPS alpha-1,3-glucosyltransferase
VERLSLRPYTHFVGLQSDIRPYLWASDVFILPSAYEGLPLVCLQAAAAGLPLISTRINGVENFLSDGVNCWFVERTAPSIAAAINSAAADPAACLAKGTAAQARADDYDEQIFQARWIHLLEEQFDIILSSRFALAAEEKAR